MKGGFCVSTVSIVSGHSPGAMPLVAGCTYWPARRLARPRLLIVVADTADSADSIFTPRTDPDHSGSSSAFTIEGKLDAQCSKERLCATQAAGEGPRVLRPSRGPARKAGTRQVCTGTEEVRSTSRPRAAVCHNLPYPSGYWVKFDQVFNRGPAVCLISPSEGARGPERRFTCGGPQRKVSHPGKPFEVNAWQVAQAVRGGLEQRS
jgi:hypothetical protein